MGTIKKTVKRMRQDELLVHAIYAADVLARSTSL